MATTQFELVTPSRTLFSGEAEMIVCRAVNGEIAFLADHMPYIGALDPGVVRIVGASQEDGEAGSGSDVRLAVHGGFVEVKDNHVIMLADEALLPSEIDVSEAQRELDAAGGSGGPATGGGDGEAADNEAAWKWAQARIDAAN
jgi:F-type H+-transporting ATPase subunit epsilon